MIEFITPSRRRPKRRPIILAALLVITVAVGLVVFGRAEAQTYLANRSAWDDLPQEMKEGFAAGVVESFSLEVIGNDSQSANAVGFQQCVAELDLDTADLAMIVDDGYSADVARWNEPPLSVLVSQLFRVCRSTVNQAREERGLAPLAQRQPDG